MAERTVMKKTHKTLELVEKSTIPLHSLDSEVDNGMWSEGEGTSRSGGEAGPGA